MRIMKEYDERRNEILDIAEKLFHKKGYDKCTINEILKSVGIAKGTFYYYFASKEEVLDAIVSRYNEIIVNRTSELSTVENISLEEKLMRAFMLMKLSDQVDDTMLNHMHKVENALLHQKILNQLVNTMTPILVKIIEEGIGMGVWECKYPKEYMEIFLASALTLTDDGIFHLDEESQVKIMIALISVLEKMLNVPENSFLQMMQNGAKKE